MYLHYFRGQNFGDALNPWLWPKLLGKVLDGKKETAFVGIGTILNEGIPETPKKIVLGAGTGYGTLPDVSSKKWKILAVRGPLTAHALNLPRSKAATDSAALLNTIELPQPDSDRRPVFIPHCTSAEYFPWANLCSEIGIRYIDPRGDVESIISAIRSARLVIAEAMHGAIVADTLRVPWVPVKIYNHINDFKWADWSLSLEMSYQPEILPMLFSDFKLKRYLESKWTAGSGICGKIRRLPTHAVWTYRKVSFKKTNIRAIEDFQSRLQILSEGIHARLSSEKILNEKTIFLQDCVEKIKK